MRLALLLFILVTSFLQTNAQSVFKNPTTDLVETVLNEYQVDIDKLMEISNSSTASLISSPSTITPHAHGSKFSVVRNHPTMMWQWTWVQKFGLDENMALQDYSTKLKQLSNAIIQFYASKKSAVLHVKSTNVNQHNQVYLELLPMVENISVTVTLLYEDEWMVEIKILQHKQKNQLVMN